MNAIIVHLVFLNDTKGSLFTSLLEFLGVSLRIKRILIKTSEAKITSVINFSMQSRDGQQLNTKQTNKISSTSIVKTRILRVRNQNSKNGNGPC